LKLASDSFNFFSYLDATNHATLLTFEKFNAWCEKLNILDGFNLTETLLQELFSELDPHKKGNLTEIDWVNAFGSLSFL
jgi:hypothetical protein